MSRNTPLNKKTCNIAAFKPFFPLILLFYYASWLIINCMFYHYQAKKPLMEKMRRARINDSLNELKSLILEALNKDVSVSKHANLYFTVIFL